MVNYLSWNLHMVMRHGCWNNRSFLRRHDTTSTTSTFDFSETGMSGHAFAGFSEIQRNLENSTKLRNVRLQLPAN
jgi:hypothetical protein